VNLAAIDCGTNSTRLLIAAPDGTPIDRRMTITRLGQGVDAAGRLHPDAIARVVASLAEYRVALDANGVPSDSIRMVATSAARDAGNRDEFFDAAEAAIGVRPELLDGMEEGRLSFAGATADLDPADGPFVVMDIGGGSTEVICGTTDVEGVISLDVGCVRMTEKYLHSDPPTAEELSQCISVLGLYFDDVLRELPQVEQAKRLVGLAGTVSTTAAIDQGLATYDRDRIHHYVLTKPAVEDIFRSLATETRAERLENPGMEEGRVDVIVGGLCVLAKAMRALGFDECLVSEADILDGLIASLKP
jgi:exopolyphosphatase / guanosine-5'-triphosphate,3'-diphosphate pyrophosphatase